MPRASASRPRAYDGEGPRAPSRTLSILELIAENDLQLSLAEVSTKLSIPKTSAYNLLKPLLSLNYIVQIGGRYGLGPAAFRFALLANQTPFLLSVKPVLETLTEQTGESVSLCLLARAEQCVEYAIVIEGHWPIRYFVSVGQKRPLHSVSAGLVFLAWQSDEWLEDYLAYANRERFTDATIVDSDQIRKRISEIRRDGYAVSLGGFSNDVHGFAAPILLRDDKIIAALSIGAPGSRAFLQKEKYVNDLLNAAREISMSLSGLKPNTGC